MEEFVSNVDAESAKTDFAPADEACDLIAVAEDCPPPFDFSVCGCRDAVDINAGNVYLESPGRIAQINFKIKNVCPSKRTAVAVILTEVDKHGCEHSRGLKAFTVPAHRSHTCKDILIKCVKFVLPEDLNGPCGANASLCDKRNFRVRVLANYIDTDFQCCEHGEH